jgi:predicted secreted protein
MPHIVRTAAAVAAVLVALSGCGGSSGPTAFGPGERSVSVAKGDTFTLEVPANPALGQNWYLAGPHPDKSVVTYQGRREEEEGGDEDLIGSADGAQFFDFTAHAAGTTTVKLLFCPHGLCSSASEVTASPVPTATSTAGPARSDDEVAYYVYTITVR